MTETNIKNVVEAALLAAGRPLQLTELAQLFGEAATPDTALVRGALDALEVDYGSRGIELKETANGFRIQVRRELANEVSRLWPERPPRYSRALLETLALIAYRQPITRAEIEAVRGVAVNPNIIKTVLERNWVRVVGTRDVPGRPELLGTTKDFLDYFGLRGLEDLPTLAELKAMGDVNLQLDLAKPADPTDPEGGTSSSGSEGSGGAGGSLAALATAAAVGAVAAEVGEAAAAQSASGEGESADAPAGTGAHAAVALASDSDAEASEPVAEANESDAETHEAVALASDAGVEASETVALATDAEVSETVAEATLAEATQADAEAPPAVAESHEIVADVQPEIAAEALGHVEIESDSGDVTVEVRALDIVEAGIEATIESDDPPAADAAVDVASVTDGEAPDTVAEDATPVIDVDAAFETGEFEMAELGMEPANVIEAEFDADDLDTVASDEEGGDEEGADDEEELSADAQSSSELVAGPRRDRDD